MPKGGSTVDDIAKAVIAKIMESRRPVSAAAKSSVDEAGKLASTVKGVVTKALGKGKKTKPRVAVTSKTAKTTSPKPPKIKTKAEKRLENQRLDAERIDKMSQTNAAQKAAKKAENRKKFLDKEKQNIDERFTAKTQRESGGKIINETVDKKLKSIEYKERLTKNQGGLFDYKVDEMFKERMASIKEDGYKLNKKEIKEMYASIRREVAESGERNLDTMNKNLAEKMAKYKKMTPQEMDTEAGRQLFRRTKFNTKTGTMPVDKRSRLQILEDKRLTEAAEAAASKKSSTARLSEKGTGPEKGPRPDKPFKESESGLKLQKAQREGAEKSAKVRNKERMQQTSKKLTAEELRQTKIITAQEAEAKQARRLGVGGGEGYNMKTSSPLRSGSRNETVEELNARLSANRAKIAKENKKSNSKRK